MQTDPTYSRRQGRVWRFSNAMFDENTWQLQVDGERQRIEVKPLELLHELLLNAGRVVGKEQLLAAVWPDVHVVEASIPTAIGKLRKALGDERTDCPIIETVPRIGYRLTCEVRCEFGERQPATVLPLPLAAPRRRLLGAAGMIAGGAALAAMALGYTDDSRQASFRYSSATIKTMMNRLDQPNIEALLRSGWDPNTSLDKQGSTALSQLLEVCEWNPGHDHQVLLQLARLLIDAGARPDLRNYWGDTPYSIASAPRYCGPTHPATILIRTICYNGANAPGDKCLADYEHSAAAGNRGKLP